MLTTWWNRNNVNYVPRSILFAKNLPLLVLCHFKFRPQNGKSWLEIIIKNRKSNTFKREHNCILIIKKAPLRRNEESKPNHKALSPVGESNFQSQQTLRLQIAKMNSTATWNPSMENSTTMNQKQSSMLFAVVKAILWLIMNRENLR